VGGKTLHSNASGQASVALRRGSYSATATAPTYTSASAHFRVH
jgi:hypothetical protein